MSVEKCKSATLKYVSLRLRSQGQVEDYLIRKEFDREEIEIVLSFLREYRYVDDQYFCISYYKEGCRKGRGLRRIEQELERKKVPRSVIRETLDEFLSDENPDYQDIRDDLLTEKERALKTARKMAENHVSEGRRTDKNFMAKVGRRLMSLGYGSDIIYGVIGILMKEYPMTRD